MSNKFSNVGQIMNEANKEKIVEGVANKEKRIQIKNTKVKGLENQSFDRIFIQKIGNRFLGTFFNYFTSQKMTTEKMIWDRKQNKKCSFFSISSFYQ